MKKLAGPFADMGATLLSNHNKIIAKIEADSKSKYGFVQKAGVNIPWLTGAMMLMIRLNILKNKWVRWQIFRPRKIELCKEIVTIPLACEELRFQARAIAPKIWKLSVSLSVHLRAFCGKVTSKKFLIASVKSLKCG